MARKYNCDIRFFEENITEEQMEYLATRASRKTGYEQKIAHKNDIKRGKEPKGLLISARAI